MLDKDLFRKSPLESGIGTYLHQAAKSPAAPLPDLSYRDETVPELDYDNLEYQSNKNAVKRGLAAGLTAAGIIGAPFTWGASLLPAAIGAETVIRNTKGLPKGYSSWDYAKDAFNSWLNNLDETNIRSNQGNIIYEIDPELEKLSFEKDYLTKMLNSEQALASMRESKDPVTSSNFNLAKQELDQLTPQYVQSINERFGEDKALDYLNLSTQDKLKEVENGLKDLTAKRESLVNEANEWRTDMYDREAGNNLIFNHKVSDVYKELEEDTDFSFTDLDSWLFKIPGTLGSSFASWEHQAKAIGSMAMANFARTSVLRAAAATTLTPQIIAGANVLSAAIAIGATGYALTETWASRERETFAELFENYSQKVRAQAEANGVDLKALIEEGRANMDGAFNSRNLTDDQILDLMISSEIPSSNETFNAIRSSARTGTDHLYNQNMALSAVDMGQMAIAIPFVGSTVAAATRGVGKVMQLPKLAKAVNKGLDKVIDYGAKVTPKLHAIASGPTTKAFGKHIGAGIIGKAALVGVSEAYEEGNQYIGGQRFIQDMYDNRKSNLFNGLLDNIDSMYEATKAVLGIGESAFMDDHELFQSMTAGAMIGGLMGSPANIFVESKSLPKQLQANKYVRRITAEQMKDKEDFLKAKLYADQSIAGKGKEVLQALEWTKDNLPEGVTKEDIDNEIKRAKLVMSIAGSKFINNVAEELAIPRNSQDFTTLVGMSTYLNDKFEQEFKTNNELWQQYQNAYTSEEYDASLDKLVQNDNVKQAVKHITQRQTEIAALTELLKQLEQNKSDANAFNQQFGTNLDTDQIGSYIDKVNLQLAVHNDYLKNYQERLSKAEANFSVDDILPYNFNDGTKADPITAYQKLVLSTISFGNAFEAASMFNGVYHPFEGYNMDPNTAIVSERRGEEFYSNLNENDKAYVNNFIKERIDKYNQVEKKTRELAEAAAELKNAPEAEIKQVADEMVADNVIENLVNPKVEDGGLAFPRTPDDYGSQELYDQAKSKFDGLSEQDKKKYIDRAKRYDKQVSINEADWQFEQSQPDIDSFKTDELRKDFALADTPEDMVDVVGETRGINYTKRRENLNKFFDENRETFSKYGIKDDEVFVNFDDNDEIITPKETDISNAANLQKWQRAWLAEKYGINTEAAEIPDNTIDDASVKPADLFRNAQTGTLTDKQLSEQGVDPVQESPVEPEDLPEKTTETAQTVIDDAMKVDQQHREQALLLAVGELSNTEINEGLRDGSVPTKVFPGMSTDAPRGKTSHTLFYNPDSFTPMEDGFEPGHELGKVLADPEKSGNFAYEFVVQNFNGKYDPTDTSTWDNATVSVIITDTTNGKRYMAAMKEPAGAVLLHQQTNTPDPEVVKADVDELRIMRNKIIEAYNTAQQTGGRVVPTTVNMTNGVFNVRRDADGRAMHRPIHQITAFGFSNTDLVDGKLTLDAMYNIDSNTVELGIAGGIRGNWAIYDKYGGQLAGTGGSGKIFAYPKYTPSGKPVNVQLSELPISRAVADLIYELLVNQRNSNSDPYMIEVDGKQVQSGFTPMSLLSLIINNGVGTLDTTLKDTDIVLDFLETKKLHYDNATDIVIIGKNSFTRQELLNDPVKQLAFKTQLTRDFHWNIDKTWLWEKIGEIIPEIKNYFMTTGQDKLVLIPGVMEISIQEAGFVRKDDGIVEIDFDHVGGISWIAWYANNGILRSDVHDQVFINPFMYVEDVVIEQPSEKAPETVEEEKEQIAEVKAETEEVISNPIESLFRNAQTGDMPVSYKPTEDESDLSDPDSQSMREFLGYARSVPYNANAKQIDIEAESKWLRDVLGIDPVITDEVITLAYSGKKAMGLTRDDSIMLWKGAEQGTAYHEAFHRVSRLILSPSERLSLYKAYNDRLDNKLSEKATEEALAEDFRDWMLSRSRRFAYRVQKFFNKLLKFIGFARLMTNTDIQDLYNKIRRGDFRNSLPTAENIASFNETYKDGAPFTLGTSDNPVQFKHIPTLYNYYKILDSLQAMLFYVNRVRSVEDISQLNEGKLKDFLYYATQNEKQFTLEQRLVLSEILQHFDSTFFPDLKLYLDNLGIRVIDRNREDNQSKLETEDVKSGEIQEYDKASYEISKKDNARFAVKTFIAQIARTEIDPNNEKGSGVKPIYDELTGLPSFFDFDTSWNSMIMNLHDVQSHDQMINRIAELGKTVPFFRTLHNKLLKDSAIEGSLKTQLLTTVQSLRHNMMYVSYGNEVVEDIDPRTRKPVTVNRKRFVIGDSNLQRAAKTYPLIWSGIFYNSSGIINHTEAGSRIDSELATSLVDRYDKLVSDVNLAVNNKQMTKELLDKKKQDLVNLLREIGIGVDIDVLNRAMERIPNLAELNEFRAFQTLLTNPRGFSVSRLFNKLLQAVIDGKPLEITGANNRVIPKPLNEIFKWESFVTSLATAHAEIYPRPEELSVLGADGNLLYPFAELNYMGDMMNWLEAEAPANRKRNELIDNLDSVPYNQGSMILDALKANPRRKITDKKVLTLHTFVNFFEESSGDRGRDYLSISSLEDYLSKMTLAANDHLLLPTLADKKTYFTISGIKLFHEGLTSVIEDGRMSLWLGMGAINQYLRYASAEWAAIKDFYSPDHREVLKNNPEKAVMNYHTKSNGGRFRYFKGVHLNVNGKNVFYDFNVLLDAAEKDGNIQSGLDFIESAFFGKDTAFKQGVINEMLKLRVLEEIKTAERLGIIYVTENETSRIPNLVNDKLDEIALGKKIEYYKNSNNPSLAKRAETYAIFDMIADYVINSGIGITEFGKIFSKDPAFYNGMDDLIKRYGEVLSTGTKLDTESIGREKYTAATIEDNFIASHQFNTLLEMSEAAFYDRFRREQRDNVSDEYIRDMAKKAAKKEMEPYKGGINQTDASVYISPRMYKDIVIGLGEWTPEVIEAFDLMESDQDWLSNPELYAKAMKVLIKPLKMTYFGDHFDNELKLNIPIYDKMALFPMFKVIATGDNRVLYERMVGIGEYSNASPIDMIKTENAVKVGKQKIGKLYTNSDNTSLAKLHDLAVYDQHFRFLRRQLITDPHTEERQLFGTQVAKGALGNLEMNRVYNNKSLGVEGKTGFELKTEVFGAMNALSNIGAYNFLKKIGDFVAGEFVGDIEKLSKVLARDVVNSKMPYDILEGLEVRDGKFRIPLSALSDSKWLESRMISVLNRETVDIAFPGGAFIQMSSFAMNTITASSETAYNGGKKLLFYDKNNGSMEAMVSMNLFKHIIPESKQTDHATMRKWLIDSGIIGRNTNPSAIGYRIPTQGLSSIAALKIVDVLPENIGDTIILPDEFTALTGADFDIDKLYVARYNYEKVRTPFVTDPESEQIEREFEKFISTPNYSPRAKKDIVRKDISDFDSDRARAEFGNIIKKYYDVNEGRWRVSSDYTVRKVQFNDDAADPVVLGQAWEDEATRLRDLGMDEEYITLQHYKWLQDTKGKTKWDLNSREANENRMLDMYMLSLTDSSRINETRAALDAPMAYLKGTILQNVEGKGRDNLTTYEGLSPTYQMDKKYEYTIGKNGIAPFALNNVHHVLTQLTGLTFKQINGKYHRALESLKLGRLDGIYSRDKNRSRILDWLSILINAHVDVAKDPYIIRLNITPWTYNMTNFMLRSGVGENTFYFMSQPILKEISQKVATTMGRYGMDNTKSQNQREKDAIDSIVSRYWSKLGELAVTDEQKASLDDLKKSRKDGNTIIDNRHVIWSEEHLLEQLQKGREGNHDFDYYFNQILTYRTWQQMEPYALGLSELVHTSQIDTKKTGNNFMLQKSFLYRVKRSILDNKVFNQNDIKRFFNDTFLDTKLRNSVILGSEIFQSHLLRSNKQFVAYHNAMLAMLGQLDTKNERLVNQISNALEAKIKSDFFNKYMEDNGINPYNLFYGKQSMALRLIGLKNDIMLGKYPDMLDNKGRIKNEFVTYIEGRPGNPVYDGYFAPDFITTNTLHDSDRYLQDKLKRYWEELLTHSDEKIRKFAEDLVVFAFVTSGDNMTINNIFNLVPLNYREKIGYSKYIQDTLDNMNDGLLDMDLDDVFKNNWNNGYLVPDIIFTRRYRSFDGWNTDTLDSIMSNDALPGTTQHYPLVIFNKRGYSIGVNQKDQPIFHPYVKYNVDGTKNPGTTLLYKYVGNYQDGDRTVPVYTAVHKKGLNANGIVVTEYDKYAKSSMLFNNLPNKRSTVKLSRDEQDINNLFESASFLNENRRNRMRKMLQTITYIEDFNVNDVSMSMTYDQIMGMDMSDTVENEQALLDSVMVELGGDQYANLPYVTDFEEATDNSGGAHGADIVWAEEGIKRGMTNINHYYHGKKTPKGNVEISEQDFEEGWQMVLQANETLKRQPDNYKDLLARNWMQVKNSDAIYAIGQFQRGTNLVDGGTGWAVQMAIDNQKPVFFYDQQHNDWYLWSYITNDWAKTSTPILTNSFAGIGTREINEKGVQAIKNVYDLTFERPMTGENLPETWSKKEGWSVEYFNNNVRPRVFEGKAYQIEYTYIGDTYDGEVAKSGIMSYDYAGNNRSDVTAESTIDAIRNGERTATTRYSDNKHFDYWTDVKVGDVIEFKKSKDSDDVVYVMVTSPLTKLTLESQTEDLNFDEPILFNSQTKGYEVLSNFYNSTVIYEGMEYPTAEHAFQAAKTTNLEERKQFTTAGKLTPAAAKKAGRDVTLRKDWDNVKDSFMYDVLKAKFTQNEGARKALLDTGDSPLIHDTSDPQIFKQDDKYWGNGHNKDGQNVMGTLLEDLRNELRSEYGTTIVQTTGNSQQLSLQFGQDANEVAKKYVDFTTGMTYALSGFEEYLAQEGIPVTDELRAAYGRALMDANSRDAMIANWKEGVESGRITKDEDIPGGYHIDGLNPNAGGKGGHVYAYRQYYESRYEYGRNLVNRYSSESQSELNENDFDTNKRNRCINK